MFSAYAVTEPEAGSDVARVKTTATKIGNDYVLNGVKWWITNGSVASWYFVLARVDDRPTGFIVPADSPGIVRGPKEHNLGQHASNTVRVTFEDVKVPEAYRLGAEGDGFNIAMETFNHTRPGVAAGANGITKAALNIALSYAKRRRTFDKKLISNQGISFKLAEMMTRLDAARFLDLQGGVAVRPGPRQRARGRRRPSGSPADVAMQAALECAQVLGGYGYTNEMPAEKLIRDAKIYQIYEGATEIQKMIIVSKLMRMQGGLLMADRDPRALIGATSPSASSAASVGRTFRCPVCHLDARAARRSTATVCVVCPVCGACSSSRTPYGHAVPVVLDMEIFRPQPKLRAPPAWPPTSRSASSRSQCSAPSCSR